MEYWMGGVVPTIIPNNRPDWIAIKSFKWIEPS